jgi:putative ATPase
MALAPKSNAMEVAYMTAKADAEKALADPVPLHLRNAVTGLMKDLDYGKGYRYAHDYAEKLTDMQCLPDALADKRYYLPTNQGEEADFAQKLEAIRAWKDDQH